MIGRRSKFTQTQMPHHLASRSVLLMGHIGSHMDITSRSRRYQVL